MTATCALCGKPIETGTGKAGIIVWPTDKSPRDCIEANFEGALQYHTECYAKTESPMIIFGGVEKRGINDKSK